MLNRRAVILLVIGLALLGDARRASADGWWEIFDHISEMSGPGPFGGVHLTCRKTLFHGSDDDKPRALLASVFRTFCSDGVGLALPTIFDEHQQAGPEQPTQPLSWLRTDIAYRFGDRLPVDSPRTRVNWWAVETSIETAEHWAHVFRRLESEKRFRLFSGVGVSANLFHGEGFSPFFEPSLKVSPVGVIVFLTDRWGLEVAPVDYRLIQVSPRQFRLDSTPSFDGRAEWLRGTSLGVYYRFWDKK